MLEVHDCLFGPPAKWRMPMAGNYGASGGTT
jgi:hypothetical protein